MFPLSFEFANFVDRFIIQFNPMERLTLGMICECQIILKFVTSNRRSGDVKLDVNIFPHVVGRHLVIVSVAMETTGGTLTFLITLMFPQMD